MEYPNQPGALFVIGAAKQFLSVIALIQLVRRDRIILDCIRIDCVVSQLVSTDSIIAEL